MRIAIASLVLLAACGAAAHEERSTFEPPPPASTIADAPALFAGHGALVLQSEPSPTRPAFYAELAPDGAITGTRCGATRLTEDGRLEREGHVVAAITREGDGFGVHAGERDLGWRIGNEAISETQMRATMTTVSDTRYTAFAGTITPSGAQLPTISFDPPDGNESLALALFATLLVCDDVGP